MKKFSDMVRKEKVDRIVKMVKALGDPYGEIITDIWVCGGLFNSVEVTKDGFKLNTWDDISGEYELELSDENMDLEDLDDLIKELEAIF